MNKTINYEITFLSDWHCGSGLSAGADISLLVIKDKDNLPYVPGKTLKGLIREAVEEIAFYEHSDIDLIELFGVESNGKIDNIAEQGCCFFTNAVIKENVKEEIIKNNLQEFMYHRILQTSIDDSGVAKKNSLREMQVTIPCELRGQILNIPVNFDNDEINEHYLAILEKGLRYINRLGHNRNRGLGRCIIKIVKED